MNRVNAPDGTPLVYDAYEPPSARSAVLFLHDWAPAEEAPAARWAAMGAQLRDAGYAAYFLEQRGHGRSGGRRLHLSRFSQLLGDLQAFRRAVRRRTDVPQILFGHGFGALVILRYLETQPGEPPIAAILSSPWLASRRSPAIWKRLAARFADVWPTMPSGAGHDRMTAGARAEIAWAQRAVAVDHHRIECSLMFLLGERDADVDAALARSFADGLGGSPLVHWYPNLRHDLLTVGPVMQDVLEYLSSRPSAPVRRGD